MPLPPAHQPLLSTIYFLGAIAQFADEFVARLNKPWHPVRDATVFFFVSALTAPVVNLCAASFPVAQHVPLNKFIGPEALAGAEAGIAPEFHNLVETWEDSAGNALPFWIAGPQQQY